nr:MAG TPA: hypothetical protein [Caudoviricetes sp.]
MHSGRSNVWWFWANRMGASFRQQDDMNSATYSGNSSRI